MIKKSSLILIITWLILYSSQIFAIHFPDELSKNSNVNTKALIPNKINNSSSINIASGVSLMNPDNTPCNLKEPLVNGVNFDNLTASVLDNVPTGELIETCIGSMSDALNLVDANLTNFASVDITGVGCNGEFQVVDSNHVYPAGMFAGFKVSSDGLLQASTGLNVTIRTYLGNVLRETYAPVTDDGVSGLDASSIDADGNAILGFNTTNDFDEIRIEYQNTAGALFLAEVYYPVVQKFCEATLLCNAPTSFTNPVFPVIINYSNTGPDSVTCALCTVTDAENLITSSDLDYASLQLTLGLNAEASIAVEDLLTTYPANNFAGFEIENIPVLAGSLEASIKITTYLDGAEQEFKTGTFALAGTTTVGVNDKRIVGFITTVPFDQIQLTFINTAGVDLGETRVYRAVVEKFCPVEIPCNETVYLNNGDPGFPIIIDEFKTGLTGIGCVGCAVNNSSNVISPDLTDFAKIEILFGASISGTISVVDAVSTFPEGSIAGFAIEDVLFDPLLVNPLDPLGQLNLLAESITICTWLDGVQQECKSATDLLDLTAVPDDIFGTAEGRYNIGFQTTFPYDEITITVAPPLVGALIDLKVFGAFVDTSTATGEFGALCNPLPALTTVKTATTTDYAVVGDPINYDITVTNTGNVTIDNVVVTDANADAGSISYVSGDDGDNILQVGETWTYTAVHTVTQADLDAGSVLNTATASGLDTNGGSVEDASDQVTVTGTQSPALTTVKTATTTDYAVVGDPINYDITVTNTGNVTIDNVVVTDANADAGSISYVSGDDGDNILQVGETWTYTAVHTVTQADLDAGSVLNTATASGLDTNGGSVEDASDQVTVTGTQSPALTTVKTATTTDYAVVGDPINYDITVTNTGNVTIDNVVVTDANADAGSISYVSGDDGDNILQVGETWTYTAVHTVTQADLDAGSVLNTATASGLDTNGGSVEDASDQVTVTGTQSPALTTVKTATTTDYAVVGDPINYDITVTNTGNVTIDNVVVTDANADAGSISYVSGDDGDNILQVGETWTYTAVHTVTQADLDAGSVLNTATASGLDTNGGSVEDASDQVTVTGTQSPALTTVKTATTTDYAVVGDPINYDITVTNTGNVTIDNVVVTDANADAGSISYVSGDDGDNILQVGETWTYTAVHTVTQADLDAGSVLNTATASGLDTNGGSVEDASDQVTVDAIQNNSITTVKSTTETAYAVVGTILDYTITLENDGNTTVYTPRMADATADADPVHEADQIGNDDDVLNVGEIWTYTAQHTVTQLDIDRGFYTNTAEGDALADNDGDGVGDAAVESDESETVDAIQTNAVVVSKTSTEDRYGYGDVIHYTITLANTGNTTVYGPTVSDPDVTTGPTYVSGDTDTDSVLDVGETWTYNATHTITQSDSDSFTNTATGSGSADNDGDGMGDAPVSDTDDDTVTAIPNQTGFARSTTNATCFLDDGLDRWGWTNYFATEGFYTLPLYIGAAQCDLDKGKLVGTVLVNYTGGEVTITYNVDAFYGIRQIHVYVGCEPYPTKKRSTTVAPGQYPYKISTLDHVSSYTVGPINVSSLENGVYVIAHALISEHLCYDCYEAEDDGGIFSPRKNSVSCSSGKNTSKESNLSKESNITDFKAYPVPFKESLTIQYDFEYTSKKIEIQIFDLSGRLLRTYYDKNVSKGDTKKLDIDFELRSTQVYIIRMVTDREVISKNVISYP